MTAAGPRDAGAPLPPDGGHAHVLVVDVERPDLDDERLHHLARVRRLRDGEPCTVTDGAGAWRWCVFRGGTALEPDGPVHRLPRPDPRLTVAIALIKGERPDWAVQKLTELGIDVIVPFRAERSVVRWDEAKEARHLGRLRAIARSATQQSRRCFLPVVEPVADVAALAARGAVRLDRGGPPPGCAHSVVAVGPEGGWSDAEREALPEAVGLGETVLRSETAALTAGAVMVSLRSGIVAPLGKTTYEPGKPPP